MANFVSYKESVELFQCQSHGHREDANSKGRPRTYGGITVYNGGGQDGRYQNASVKEHPGSFPGPFQSSVGIGTVLALRGVVRHVKNVNLFGGIVSVARIKCYIPAIGSLLQPLMKQGHGKIRLVGHVGQLAIGFAFLDILRQISLPFKVTVLIIQDRIRCLIGME